jgi:hypothetical protein
VTNNERPRVSVPLGPAIVFAVLAVLGLFWFVRWVTGVLLFVFKAAFVLGVVAAVAWLFMTRKKR